MRSGTLLSQFLRVFLYTYALLTELGLSIFKKCRITTSLTSIFTPLVGVIFEAPITTAAHDIYKYFFIVFQRK